ncbi:MAG: hypothetical protein JW781_04825 [Deltaproteobacteria bacterium]|nr:hypothetical protein [Candidatus Anaeroferrophillacea bacterium]
MVVFIMVMVTASLIFWLVLMRLSAYAIRWLEISNRPGFSAPAGFFPALLPWRLVRPLVRECFSSIPMLFLWGAGRVSRRGERQVGGPRSQPGTGVGMAAVPETPETGGSSVPPVVVMVPGYLMTTGCLWPLARRLRRAGFCTLLFDVADCRRAIVEHAAMLRDHISRCVPAGTPVVLLGHSMGGMVCRAAAREWDADRLPLRGVIALGSPHRGTMLWSLGMGPAAREMRPGSKLLGELARAEEAVAYHRCGVYSRFDELVIPNEHGRWAGAREVVVDDVGHFMLVLDRRVAEILAAEVGRICKPPGPGYN